MADASSDATVQTSPPHIATALAAFSKGKGNKGSKAGSSTDGCTELQAQQKRQASMRNTALANAPEHVREKWQAICALRGRDRNKNHEKSKFTEMILKDSSVLMCGCMKVCFQKEFLRLNT